MAKGKRRKASPADGIAAGLVAFERVLDKVLDVAVKDPDALPGMHPRQGNPVTLGARVPEADEWAGKMVQNATAAGERWLANVQRPKKDPITAARAAAGKYKGRVQEALTEGRWEKGVARIDEDEMYRTIREGGSAPFTSGVTRRTGKINRRIAELRPLVVGVADTIDKMPQDTDAQREARMVAARRGMLAVGKKLRGG